MTLATTPAPSHAAADITTMRAAFGAMMVPPYSAHFVDEVKRHFETGFPVRASVTATHMLTNNSTSDAHTVASSIQPLWALGVLQSTANSGAQVLDGFFHDGFARAFMVKGSNSRYHAMPRMCIMRCMHHTPLID